MSITVPELESIVPVSFLTDACLTCSYKPPLTVICQSSLTDYFHAQLFLTRQEIFLVFNVEKFCYRARVCMGPDYLLCVCGWCVFCLEYLTDFFSFLVFFFFFSLGNSGVSAHMKQSTGEMCDAVF